MSSTSSVFQALIVILTIALLPQSASSAYVLDGRTNPFSAGEREDGGQMARVHFIDDGERCLRVVTAGVRTRNASPAPPTASGVIVLPNGPTAENIVWAGLYWVILANAPPINAVTLNGSPVVPVALPVTPSPCWPALSARAYFSDVTGLVTPGSNTVDGLDDSGTLSIPPESEGVSLVVVYEDQGTTACEIIVIDGNDLLSYSGQKIVNTVPVTCVDGLNANVYFIGADGQTGSQGPAPDEQIWNSLLLGGSDGWSASDPGAPGSVADLGWDTDGWSVMTGGLNQAAIRAPQNVGPADCVSWVATVLEAGVRSCIPPLPTGACCSADGACQAPLTQVECGESGGMIWIPHVDCDPNPCPPTPTGETTWGKIKTQFR